LAKTVGRFEDEGWRVRKDGTRFWASAVLDAVRDDDGNVIGFAKITRDLTERRAVQEALEQSERQFRLLVNGVIDYAIFMLDPQGKVASWNSGARQLKGYTADEIVGRSFVNFYSEEDRAAGLPQKLLSIARDKGKVMSEGWRVRKDGTRFWASVIIDAVHDETGQLIGFAKVTRDLTEQRESELKLEEAREQLFQAQKMEAIGQLTGGVAHDFNNLLTVIVSGADLAEPHIKDNERLKRLIGNMRHAAMRGERLTKQLLAFSRRQPLKPETIDVAQQLSTFIDLLAHSLRGDIRVVSEVPTNLPPVQVDVGQLELALLNIGLNARDAMPEGGTLTIRARKHGGELQGRVSAYVVVDIADTGIGMSSEVQARAFEPFFTTKDIGRGSGLGLSQAYGFAKQSGGALTLESEPGKGTKISLHLPTASGTENRWSQDQPAARPRDAGSATVLLVEDDAGVSELTHGLLQDAGYKVKTAGTAAEALQVLRNGEPIDLVFSDIMMPGGMNGAELARIVRGEFPSIFILLATGYAEAAANAATQEFPLIRKPYGRDMLLDKVGEILGEVVS
jgi:PAS domain S-box-containing protein